MEVADVEMNKKLEAMAARFVMLKPDSSGTLALSLEIRGYMALQFLVRDLVKVSLAALDAEHEDVTVVRHTQSAVRGVLELALQLMPVEEMGVLDGVRGMVGRRNDCAPEIV